MAYPDRIFALGGAGKEVTLTLLEQDWVLEDILQPRPNPESVTVTILDSADGEENPDRRRIDAIRNRIRELGQELRDTEAGRTGNISIDYKLITENIQLSDSNDLIGEQTVSHITAGTGMDEETWWLQDQHINENLKFAKGVVRKRGLGKALYYKAYAEDDEISSIIDLPEKGQVAMIVGLGGGTGSGLMIDIARHLKEKQSSAEITMFGILPNHIEGIEESTNAYAALSELEYLSLTPNTDDIFKDLILLPIDPTGFGGEAGDIIRSEEALEEFDEACVYLLLSYYNTESEQLMEDPFRGSPKYAPFTIGIPQVLRYNIESINEARESIRETLDHKQMALEAEEEIYAQINRFLDRHYGDVSENGLSEADKTDLIERIENIEALLSIDLFEELNYKSIDIFTNILQDADEESDSIVEKTRLMASSVRAVDTTSQETGNFVEDLDKTFAEIIEDEILLLGRRKKLLERKRVVDDGRIRNTIEYLMSTDEGNQISAGVQLQRLEAKLEDLEDRREGKKTELEETKNELEELQKDQEEEIQQRINKWERDIQNPLKKLRQLEEVPIESRLTRLETSLEQFNSNVVNAQDEDAVENLSGQDIIEALDTLENELEPLGLNLRDRAQIEGSLQELKRAKIALLQIVEEESWWEKYLPGVSKTEEKRDEAHKEYRMVKTQLDDKNVFNIGPPSSSFSSEVTYNSQNLLDEYRRHKRELKDDVVRTLEEMLEEPSEEPLRNLREELDHGTDAEILHQIVRQAFEDEIAGTENVEDRKNEIEAELEDVIDQIEVYEAALGIFDNLKRSRTTFEDNISAYYRSLNEYEDEPRRSVATETDDYVYVKNIQPENIFRATGSNSLAETDLFSNQSEAQRLEGKLKELAKNTRSQKYTTLRRRRFSKGRTRYGEIRVRVGVASRAIDQIDSDILDIKDIFSEAFDLGASGSRVKNPYTTWRGNFGGDWDIGLSVFIDGVFLDNIRKFVQADGYRSCYLERESRLGEDILIHHSFGLDKGYYIRRETIINLEDETAVEFYLNNDEATIADELLQQHVNVVDISSPTPLESPLEGELRGEGIPADKSDSS